MDFLVMLEESPEQPAVLARVDSVPARHASEHARDVVTLYGTPSSESLALALAAAVEGHRTAGNGSGAFRHLHIKPEGGAVGDAAWRDSATGELITRDLDIPSDVVRRTAGELLKSCGASIQRLIGGLSMPDWPEGAWRAINITLDTIVIEPARTAKMKVDELLDTLREADGLAYEYEGD